MKKTLQGTAALLFLLLGAFALLYRRGELPGVQSGSMGQPTSPSAPLASPGAVAPPAKGKEGAAGNFQRFLLSEAASVGSPNVDAAAAAARVAAAAAAMTEPEIEAARDLALAPGAPGSQRVLATYLLTAGGKKSWRALKDIALAPTSSSRAEPHTVDELKNTQGKALSLMAVDALAQQAATDPAAREELLRWESEAKDATIRSYIGRKLRELR
jgi:hypothetical protein